MIVSDIESFSSFEAVSDYFFALNEDGEIIHINRSVIKTFGIKLSEGKKVYAKDIFMGWADLLQTIRDGSNRGLVQMFSEDGPVMADLSLSQAVYKGRKIFLAVARPYSSDRIFENESVFHSDVFQVSKALFLITDRKGVVINANSACAAISGYSLNELRGKNIFDLLILSSEIDIVRARLSALSDNCKSNTSINSWKARSGEVRLISWANTLYVRKNGNDYIVSTGIDITEQKRVEDSLKKSEERLTLALEASNHGLWDVNLMRREVYFSPSYYKMLGYDPDNFKFSVDTWRSQVNPYDLPLVDQFFSGRLLKLKEPFEVEFRMRTKEGAWKWFLAWGRVVEADANSNPVRLSGIFTDFSQRKKVEESLRTNEARLRAENVRLRGSIKERFRFGDIIGKSPSMQKVYEVILQASSSSAPVIIYGESGTGKELVSRAIHDMSERSRSPFVVVNCGAIPENLIESEFFGYKKGAFSGAVRDNPGFLEQVDKGTLFLDEIGEIGLGMQVKLLRAIEGGGFTPIGSNEVKFSNFRIIAATNRDLTELIKQGKMRRDFFYRIHVIPVNLPPLRERADDIPLLVQHFCEIFRGRDGEPVPDHLISAMKKYTWPGNVRELQNAIHRYVTLNTFDIPGIGVKEDEASLVSDFFELFSGATFKEAGRKFERLFIKGVLDKHSGNRTHASKYLDIERRTLLRKLKELDIE